MNREPSPQPSNGHSPTGLHRYITGLVGLILGMFLASVIAFSLTLLLIEGGIHSVVALGYFSEFVPHATALFAAPGGMLGGVTSGLSKGTRPTLAVAFAVIPGVLFAIMGALTDSNVGFAVFLAIILTTSTTASTWCIRQLLLVIGRRTAKEAPSREVKQSPAASIRSTDDKDA